MIEKHLKVAEMTKLGLHTYAHIFNCIGSSQFTTSDMSQLISDGKLEDRLSSSDNERHGLANPYEDYVLSSYNSTGRDTQQPPPFIYDKAQGVNFYLRLGAIGMYKLLNVNVYLY